jgi:hypothetical protein
MHLITQGQVHHGNTRGVFLLLIKLWANRSRDFPFRYFQTKLKCGIYLHLMLPEFQHRLLFENIIN